MPFFLLHKVKPEPEMLSSFVGAIALGWFCWRARSFLPGFLLHWVMNAAVAALAFSWRHLG